MHCPINPLCFMFFIGILSQLKLLTLAQDAQRVNGESIQDRNLASSDSLRLIGGNLARPGMWTYYVSLRVMPSSKISICGGAILNSNTIITAAHCMNINLWPLTVVYLGKYDDHPISWLRIKIARAIAHPEYEGTAKHPRVGYNLLIVKLATPIRFGHLKGTSDRACLAAPHDRPIVDACVAVGVGPKVNDSYYESMQIRQAALSIVDCPFYLRMDTEKIVCTQPRGSEKQGMCTGDIGTALMCPLADNPEVWLLFGVGSENLYHCGGLSFWIKVNYSKFLDWIIEQAEKVTN